MWASETTGRRNLRELAQRRGLIELRRFRAGLRLRFVRATIELGERLRGKRLLLDDVAISGTPAARRRTTTHSRPVARLFPRRTDPSVLRPDPHGFPPASMDEDAVQLVTREPQCRSRHSPSDLKAATAVAWGPKPGARALPRFVLSLGLEAASY